MRHGPLAVSSKYDFIGHSLVGWFALLGSTISAYQPLGILTRNRRPAPANVTGVEIP
jgi:hypothetical protein